MTGDFATPHLSADLPVDVALPEIWVSWSREFNDVKKQFSLIAVIKTVVADCFATFRHHYLHPKLGVNQENDRSIEAKLREIKSV